MNIVRVDKSKWTSDIWIWLDSQVQIGKYGFNKETLAPDYSYFEYWFVHSEDATAFILSFKDVTAVKLAFWNY